MMIIEYLGQVFALTAIVESIATLLSTLVFNLLFPFTIGFFPQLSYILLGLLMTIPIGCIM